ncbi:MAG: envelope stress response membrane protein PspC [Oceanospirillaceae bacterium]|nr:envelope stress response membrane protein PspC [Oceanospirillaceae bacterium]
MMGCSNRNRDPNRPNKSNGYQRNLYRNTRNGKIAGVCAGFADYFDVPNWLARLVFISLVIFTFQIAIIGYVVAIFLIDKRSYQESTSRSEKREHKVFNYHQPASSKLQDIRDRLQRLNDKVGSMEGYVTSKKYHTTNEINDL